jgi:hypothetical protein
MSLDLVAVEYHSTDAESTSRERIKVLAEQWRVRSATSGATALSDALVPPAECKQSIRSAAQPPQIELSQLPASDASVSVCHIQVSAPDNAQTRSASTVQFALKPDASEAFATRHKASFCSQFWVLFRRGMRTAYTDRQLLIGIVLETLVSAILFGTFALRKR